MAFFDKIFPLQSVHYQTTVSHNFQNNLSQTQKIEMEIQLQRKLRVLCLHGFRTSAEILRKQIERWPEPVLRKLDFVFIDAPFPARGRSGVESLFDPPYYEWFQSSQGFTEYYNFDECLAYLEDYLIKHGPFDGLLGFSQGAILSAAFPGMQSEGTALTRVPMIKFVIIISGAMFGGIKFGLPKQAADAYSSPIKLPSLHIIGEKDFLKEPGIALLESFQDPFVIYHPNGHVVPRLGCSGQFIHTLTNIGVLKLMTGQKLSVAPKIFVGGESQTCEFGGKKKASCCHAHTLPTDLGLFVNAEMTKPRKSCLASLTRLGSCNCGEDRSSA